MGHSKRDRPRESDRVFIDLVNLSSCTQVGTRLYPCPHNFVDLYPICPRRPMGQALIKLV